jgi:hypothetical protein
MERVAPEQASPTDAPAVPRAVAAEIPEVETAFELEESFARALHASPS